MTGGYRLTSPLPGFHHASSLYNSPPHSATASIHPNPAIVGERVWLDLPEAFGLPLTVIVSDLLGQPVLQLRNPSLSIDPAGAARVGLNIGALAPGIYLVRGMSGGRVIGGELMLT